MNSIYTEHRLITQFNGALWGYMNTSPTSDATRVFTLWFSLFSLTPLFIQNSVFCYHGKKSYQQ